MKAISLLISLQVLIGFSTYALAVTEVCGRKFDVGLAAYEPLAFREGGRLKGLAHDIIQELEKRTGCKFSENEYPRRSAINQMRTMRIDMFLPSASTSEFESVGDFHPIYKSERALFVLKELGGKYKSIEEVIDDKTVKFGALIGGQNALTKEEFQLLTKENRLVTTPAPDGLFQLLKERRIHAVMYTTLTANHYVKKNTSSTNKSSKYWIQRRL
ncbi:substrate-binding periplasmic protein [Bdellovibrio sp. HCB274]|uniref:substrate-binding periplasmic protein n=1 Tax=Bdellovibrio sp. HCB274 TaxID=3394361 RepID=UPI0039B46D5F